MEIILSFKPIVDPHLGLLTHRIITPPAHDTRHIQWLTVDESSGTSRFMAFWLDDVGSSPSEAPIAPSVERWQAMTLKERQDFIEEANEFFSQQIRANPEGMPHHEAKDRSADALRLHAARSGRTLYIAKELVVHYPNQKTFCPDILAVLDVNQPDDDERMAWVVADEGKGVDWVIEVLHHGDRGKDLVSNVRLYAQLGITEYFVYDRGRQQLYGYRLPKPQVTLYESIKPDEGRYASQVLQLDLAIVEGRLRFFSGSEKLELSSELIDRLDGMVLGLQQKYDLERVRADRAEARAAKAEATAKVEQARAAKAEAELLQSHKQAILTILRLRRVDVSEQDRARIVSCNDLQVFNRWLLQAQEASSAAELR